MIRKKRRELEFSQQYVALELGISQKAYSDIENGKTKIKNEILYKIAKIFNIKPSEICSNADTCRCSEELLYKNKYEKLVQFLDQKKINFPKDGI